MECLLMQSGSGFDPAEVTSTPGNVKSGKKFLGAGSDDMQTGTLATVPKVDVKLGINESYAIKPGYHTGEDVVSQSGIPTSQGLSINPTAGDRQCKRPALITHRTHMSRASKTSVRR